jgi:ATP-binding cassette subfamily F protein 3
LCLFCLLYDRYFPGPYDAFVAAQSAAVTSVTRKVEALQKQKKHMEASIAAAEKAARSAGDDKKLQQAASRKKKLADRHGAEKTESGHRFKVSKGVGVPLTFNPNSQTLNPKP